jgi:predicted dinucleotide-binding enzyme
MRVGILGAGLMGSKLGTIMARAGHEVVFSYSRDRKKLDRLAKDAGASARAGTPAEAVREADLILLAVHWDQVDEVLAQAGDLSGKLVVTCSLPMNGDNTALVIGTTTSGAEELEQKLSTSLVVSAFGTVPSEVLFAAFEERDRETRPSLVLCGDDAEAKRITATLIRDAGFEPVDAGPLRIARYAEPFALLIGQLAYEGSQGPALAYRFEWTEERD